MLNAIDIIHVKFLSHRPSQHDRITIRILLLELCNAIATIINPRSQTSETKELSHQYMKIFKLYLSAKEVQTSESILNIKETALACIELIRIILETSVQV